MSSIPVTLSIIMQPDEALAGLQAFAQQLQATVNEISSQQVTIPLTLDSSGLAAKLGDVQSLMDSNPITLPAQIDMASIQSQLDEVRTMAASQTPIDIPVRLNPVDGGGGAGADAGGGAVDGGGGAAALMGGGGLRKMFIQLEMIRAGFDLTEAGGEIAQGWAYNRADAHNEREFEAYGHGAEQARKDALKDVDKIPIVGGVIADGADAMNRFGGATKNFLEGRGFESDAGYTERMDADTKAIEKHTQQIHEESEARAKIVESLNKDTERSNLAIENAGTKGSFDRDINNIDAARLNVMDEYRYQGPQASNAKYFDAHGNILPEAAKARDAAMKALDANEDRDRTDLNERLGYDVAENQLLQDKLSGNGPAYRQDALNLRMAKERDSAYSKSRGEGDYFDKYTAPLERSEFTADENYRKYGDQAEERFTSAIASDRADRTRAEQNHNPVAAATAANKEIDDHIKLLKDEAENERLYGNAEKYQAMHTKALAAEAEGAAEKIKNMADAMKEAAARASEVARSVRDINGEAEDERLRADGKGWTADKNAAQRKYRDAFDAVEDDPKLNFAQKQEKEAALGKLMSADEYAIEKKRQKEMRDIGEDTLKYEWRSKNRPQMGELSEIEYKTIESLREHTDDPVYQMKIRNEGAAELTAFAHPEEKSQWYSSAGDYAKALNTGVLNQDQEASKEALEAAKIMKESGLKWEKVAEQLLNSQPFHIIKNGY